MDMINVDNMEIYFDQLKEVFDEGDFWNHPEAIYNLDETGVPLKPHPPKIIAKKGQKKVCYQTSGQKKQIRVVGCASANEQCLPPFVIFAAKKLNHLWHRNKVSGTHYACSKKGWIEHELCSTSLKIISKAYNFSSPLMIDGHGTHSDLKFAKDHKVTIILSASSYNS